MTGKHSARSSDSPPPDRQIHPICCTSDGPKTGPRDRSRIRRQIVGNSGLCKPGGSKADVPKNRNLRRNFEPRNQIRKCNINNLVVGCAGSPLRTRLHANSLFAGKKQGISAKIGGFWPTDVEKARGSSSVLAVKFPKRKNREFFRSQQGISGKY